MMPFLNESEKMDANSIWMKVNEVIWMEAIAWDERGHYLVEQHSQSWDLDIIKVYQQKQRQMMHCKQI